jgi:hypothetical protein
VVGNSEIVGHPSFATAIGLLAFPNRVDGQWAGGSASRRRSRSASGSVVQRMKEWVEETF